jgi:coproporphyrinogen III oxidase-like Fe-S oxidoreductase
MKTISLTVEQREGAMISDCEGFILMALYNMDKGMQSSVLKKLILFLKSDIDELEEAFESLREEGYIRYGNRRWYITEDGKDFLRQIATFEDVVK